MVKGYPEYVAIRLKGAFFPHLYCRTLSITRRWGLRLHAINGQWEGLLRGTVLTVLPSREKFEGVELLNLSNLPASEGQDPNKALDYVHRHLGDFPVIPGPEVPPRRERFLSPDEVIYRNFNAAPNTKTYVDEHVLAEDLEVPVEDFVMALERHGFTTEPVSHNGHAYLKLTRSDGEEFNIDWNHAGSNHYDGADAADGTMYELRQLPYAFHTPGLFCAIGWTRKAHSGEPLPRRTSAWPLMESEGQEDASPALKEVRAEKAEKKRIAGLDVENAKLREELAKPRWTMEEILAAFGETRTWDGDYTIDDGAMSDLQAALLRQRGLPEGTGEEREQMAEEAAATAWMRVLSR